MSKPTTPKPAPPKHSQFKKGQSGNPKGRPKKAKQADQPQSSFGIVIDKTLTITRNGQPQEVSVEEALQHKTLMEALAGNKTARREVVKMIHDRDRALAKATKPPKHHRPSSIVEHDPDNANAAMILLDIATDAHREGSGHPYQKIKLQPWAAQAALSRRRGGSKLTGKQVQEIKRCTRDPGSLTWPRGTDLEGTDA